MPLVPSEIANMALMHLASSNTVVNMQTDPSKEAAACRVFYSQAVRELLGDFPWPFATVQQPLALVENLPNMEYAYAYAYPSGCILIRRLFSSLGYNRNDDVNSRQKYRIIQLASPSGNGQIVKVILSDHTNLNVEFTGDDTLIADYPDLFKQALAFRLAYYIAPKVTAGDPFKLGERAAAGFKLTLAQAEAQAANEEVMDQARLGEFMDDRSGPIGGVGAIGWFAAPTGIIIGG